MTIIKYYREKINGVFETFDRMIVNGYILPLCNYKQFQYYLIQNNVLLKDFDKFALKQTDLLCRHIEKYINDCGVKLKYLDSGKIDKNEAARAEFNTNPLRTGLVAAFSTVELCNTMTVKPILTATNICQRLSSLFLRF